MIQQLLSIRVDTKEGPRLEDDADEGADSNVDRKGDVTVVAQDNDEGDIENGLEDQFNTGHDDVWKKETGSSFPKAMNKKARDGESENAKQNHDGAVSVNNLKIPNIQFFIRYVNKKDSRSKHHARAQQTEN